MSAVKPSINLSLLAYGISKAGITQVNEPVARSLLITFSLLLWCSYRYEQEQALVQEELLRLAKREKEAASAALQWERANAREERQRVAQMVSNKTPCMFPCRTG